MTFSFRVNLPADPFSDFSGDDAITFAVIFAIWLGLACFILFANVAFFLIKSYPLYRMAKITGAKKPYLAWIPVLGPVLQMYTAAEIARDNDFILFGKKLFKNRKTPVYISAAVFAVNAFTVVAYLALFFAMFFFQEAILPLAFFLAIAAFILLFLTGIASSVLLPFINYVYYRDILNLFNDNTDNNVLFSVLAVLIDLYCNGIASTILLYFAMIKATKKPEETENEAFNAENSNAEENTVENIYEDN